MTAATNRQFYLHQRPHGEPTTDDIRRREVPVPEPDEGELVIRNHYFSLDPAIRGWMSDTPSYMPPIEVGAPITSTTVGEVVASRHPDYQPGEMVYGVNAWEDYSLSTGYFLGTIPTDNKYPPHYYLSIFGAVGLTPYFGVIDAGKARAGQTLLMSAAAGAVGSVGGQIARIHGCRVVGLAGTDEKCRWITEELGFDAAINYRTCGPLKEAIETACPEGVDIFFDNVGGEILDAALLNLNSHARIVFCGAISSYDSPSPVPGPYNWWQILARSATVHGYLVSNYVDRFPEGVAQLSRWLDEGRIKFREEIVDGFENTFTTFRRLFDGTNQGKLIIRINDR